MSDEPDLMDDEATVTRRKRFALSPVWLIPLGAALIGFWLLYQNVVSRGPEITLRLKNAEGLEAGKTLIKVRNVEVGYIDSVRLSSDYAGVIATAQMKPDTETLLVSDSDLWLIKPRVGLGGVSGLGTLVSGVYIQLQPGKSALSSRNFTVLDHPPLTPADVPGVSVTLTSAGSATLSTGDPVIYQGQSVGQVEAAKFSVPENRMRYTVFIRVPFDTMVSQGTQFWLRSGIQFHLGAGGIDVQTGSLQAILSGGVTFGLLKGVDAGAKVNDGATFKLYASRRAAEQERFTEKIRYVILLNDSVRGLYVGAPVEYRGIRIGTVLQVPFFPGSVSFDQFADFRVPVLIAIESQRVSSHWVDWTTSEWRRNMKRYFEKKGLRATIKSANLLTGAKIIDLQFDPDASAYAEKMVGDYPVFPSEPSNISNIQQTMSIMLKKINGLKINQLMAQLQATLSASDATLNEAQSAFKNLNKILAGDAATDLPNELQGSLRKLRQTLEAYQRGAPVYRNLNMALERLNGILDNLAPVAQTLRNKPNALIFGPAPGPDPIPKAAR